jgi:1,2-phenylacetyl-CoA epoxidase PaaB subunit
MDPIYRVSFFKRLVDSTGHPSAPVQGVVEVHAASEDDAVKLARLNFAENKDICSWTLRADYHEAALLSGRTRLSSQVLHSHH